MRLVESKLDFRGYDVVVSLSDFCILIVVTLGGSQTILDMLKPQKTLTLTQVKEEVGVDLISLINEFTTLISLLI